MNTSTFVNILSQIPPVELSAVSLLRKQRRRTGELWPRVGSRLELVRVTKELIDYSKRCEAALNRLADLRPIPLRYADDLTAGFCL